MRQGVGVAVAAAHIINFIFVPLRTYPLAVPAAVTFGWAQHVQAAWTMVHGPWTM